MDVSNDIIRHAYDGEGNYLGLKKGKPELVAELAASNEWILSEDGPAAPDPLHRDLSPAEWRFFTHDDVSGFHSLIQDVLTAMPAGPDRAELEAKAFYSQTYRLAETLGLVDWVSSMNLTGITVPEVEEIRSDWEMTVARETIS